MNKHALLSWKIVSTWAEASLGCPMGNDSTPRGAAQPASWQGIDKPSEIGARECHHSEPAPARRAARRHREEVGRYRGERAGAKKPLRGTDKIALAVGRVIDHYKMAKHFTITITDDALTFTRNAPQIAAEATLDASTCCAPASSPRRSMPRRPSRFTSSSLTLSAPCAASRPSTSRSARVCAHVFL